MNFKVVSTTKPLALVGTIALGAEELTDAAARALDPARIAEMLADLKSLTTTVVLTPAENTLAFSLTQDEILSALSDIGPTNSEKLWLLVALFLLDESPLVSDVARAKAVIDLLTLVHTAKEAVAALNLVPAGGEEKLNTPD